MTKIVENRADELTLSATFVGCGDVTISAISIGIALRRHIVDIESIVVT